MAETSPATTALESREPRFDREIGRFRPLAGFDFLAVGGLHARDLEAPVGANEVKPSASTATLAGLAGDPFGSFAGSGLASKIFSLAVERRPCAGRRIAAADQPVDLLPRLAPIDLALSGPQRPS